MREIRVEMVIRFNDEVEDVDADAYVEELPNHLMLNPIEGVDVCHIDVVQK